MRRPPLGQRWPRIRDKKTLETERAENKALLPYIEQPVPRGRTCPLPPQDGHRRFNTQRTRDASRTAQLPRTDRNCSELWGSADYSASCGRAAKHGTSIANRSRPLKREQLRLISYQCPDEKYGVHCLFKSAPPSNFEPKGFEQFQLGYHHFDLLKQLAKVRTEARLAAGKTRADIAGFNDQGEPIWAIEIVRSTLSAAATKNAAKTGLPLFIIDISTLPKGSEPPFPQ